MVDVGSLMICGTAEDAAEAKVVTRKTWITWKRKYEF